MGHEVGTPMDPDNFSHSFARLGERAGLDHWHPHERPHLVLPGGSRGGAQGEAGQQLRALRGVDPLFHLIDGDPVVDGPEEHVGLALPGAFGQLRPDSPDQRFHHRAERRAGDSPGWPSHNDPSGSAYAGGNRPLVPVPAFILVAFSHAARL
jgi:hypothetical protein